MSHARSPLDYFAAEEQVSRLQTALRRLSARQRRVLNLYYGADMPMREIGPCIGGVTESRVCQIHRQALARLRGAIGSPR